MFNQYMKLCFAIGMLSCSYGNFNYGNGQDVDSMDGWRAGQMSPTNGQMLFKDDNPQFGSDMEMQAKIKMKPYPYEKWMPHNMEGFQFKR